MFPKASHFLTTLLALTPFTPTHAAPASVGGVTPHQQYSSSIGVLGCKIDTNLVAYFPSSPACQSLCVRLTYASRSLTLLHIDTSQGAHDISYDAWNRLVTGYSASEKPFYDGPRQMDIEPVATSDPECQKLLPGGKLPMMAQSPNWALECAGYQGLVSFHNIINQVCTLGIDEECGFDGAVPHCPSGMASPNDRLPEELWVKDIEVGTGKELMQPSPGPAARA